LHELGNGDLDPLAMMPMIKLVRARGEDYNRDPAEFMRVGRMPQDDRICTDLTRLVVG
jgi:hypothetical protein